MKVLFLDIDGVLNCERWFRSPEYRIARNRFKERKLVASNEEIGNELWATHIDPTALALLKSIIAELSLSVVLSSTWRMLASGCLALEKAGLSFIGKTPELNTPRGREIQHWLDANRFSGTFAILDDDGDMEHLMPTLIQTSVKDGFTEKHAQRLREIFAPEPPAKGQPK